MTYNDLAARFIALSIVYRNDLISQWPSAVTQEWLDCLNELEARSAVESNGTDDSVDPRR